MLRRVRGGSMKKKQKNKERKEVERVRKVYGKKGK